jgi:hypothetical protein
MTSSAKIRLETNVSETCHISVTSVDSDDADKESLRNDGLQLNFEVADRLRRELRLP